MFIMRNFQLLNKMLDYRYKTSFRAFTCTWSDYTFTCTWSDYTFTCTWSDYTFTCTIYYTFTCTWSDYTFTCTWSDYTGKLTILFKPRFIQLSIIKSSNKNMRQICQLVSELWSHKQIEWQKNRDYDFLYI